MISFRTHLVTLVAVFLALALGVVLGGGPLSELGRGQGEDTEALQAEVEQAEAVSSFGVEFAGESAPALYGNGLDGNSVAVLALPGADEALVEELTGQVSAAGGTVTITQAVDNSLVNPGEKSLVDTLGSQLMTQLPDGAVTPGATTYERAGELLALTVATTNENGDEPNQGTRAVADGFAGANLLPTAPQVDERAPLVLLVLGEEVTGDGADEIVGGLIRGLGERSVGVVVAAATGDEQLSRLRESSALGNALTVDGVESAVGQVSAVLGLVRSLDTQGGAFGATGSDGTVPLR